MKRILPQIACICALWLAVSTAVDATAQSSRGRKSNDSKEKTEEPETRERSRNMPSSEKGGLRYSVIVAGIKDRSIDRHRWYDRNMEEAFASMMEEALHESGRFITVANREETTWMIDELDGTEGGEYFKEGDKKPKKGSLIPAQLAVFGTITNQQKTGGSKIGFGNLMIGRKSTEVNMSFRLMDVRTRQIIGTANVVGKSTSSRLGVRVSGVDFKNEGQENVAKAIQDGLEKGVSEFINELDEVPFRGKIIKAQGSAGIVINRGLRENIESGDVFDFGSVDVIEDPDSGEVLGVDMFVEGQLQVSKVLEKMAYCRVLRGAPKDHADILIPSN